MTTRLNRRLFLRHASLLAAGGLLARPGRAASPAEDFRPPFFALCMDTHDAKKRNLADQAALLKELGYDGAGHLWLDQLSERLATLDAAGLKLFQIYLRVSLKSGEPAYDARLKEMLPRLKGRETMLALLVTGGKPSDTTLDARAVAVVTEIAGLAAGAGLRVALYPHRGDWLERVEDTVRVAKQVNRPNVGVMFNLCHWLAVDDESHLEAVLKLAQPHLFAVSLHGADQAEAIHAGRGNWIQPLGSGRFDVVRLLRLLKAQGYGGPIGLQCYGLPGDAREHLARSMKAWRGMLEQVKEK